MKALVCAILLVPATLHAQTLPGSRDLDDTKLRPGTWDVTMTVQRGEQTMAVGTARYELVELPGGQWAYITSVTTQLGTATDTSIARQRTLEPVRHRSHAVPRTLSLDYEGRHVTGSHVPTEGPAREIDRTTEVPTFDAAMLDLVLGSLPLATGYTTRLPLYIEEQEGLAWFEVEVVGETEVGSEAAWQVQVTAPTLTMVYRIGRTGRQFLGARIEYPTGAVMEVTRN